jgi:hypothetical protein
MISADEADMSTVNDEDVRSVTSVAQHARAKEGA